MSCAHNKDPHTLSLHGVFIGFALSSLIICRTYAYNQGLVLQLQGSGQERADEQSSFLGTRGRGCFSATCAPQTLWLIEIDIARIIRRDKRIMGDI